MEINTKDICEILGFKVTYFSSIHDGEVINSYFAIRNIFGEIVSQKYKNVIEPMELLRKIEKLVSEQNKNLLSQMIWQ